MSDKNNKKFWDQFAKLYGPFMKKDKGLYVKICEYICPYLNKDQDVLELACGSGQVSFELSRHVNSWLGTDFSDQMIFQARKQPAHPKLSFGVADARSLSFADGEFDCVVIANALHIMPEPDKAMEEIYRVIKARGLLFAPTFLWKEGKQSKIIKRLMSFLGFKMYREWDKKQFEDFIVGHGFSVVDMKLVDGGFAPVGVMIAQKLAP